MKLSAYTIAKNCSDKTDCRDGINELNEYFGKMSRINKKPCNSAYIRLFMLREKFDKLSK